MAGAFLGLASTAAVVGAVLAVRADRAEDAANRNAAAALSAKADATAERDKVAKANDALRRANYAAEMNLVQAAWEANNVGRVLELLDRQRPRPGEEDLRGFEWHYWNRQCHAALHTVKLPGERSQPGSDPYACSPDGAVAARVGHIDGRVVVQVWDTTTGRERQRLEGPERSESQRSGHCLAFSPDGRRLAAFLNASFRTNTNAELWVWELATGRELARFPNVGRSAEGLAFSADGARVAGALVVSLGQTRRSANQIALKVWDVDDRKEALSLPCKDGEFAFVELSPDGKRLAAAIETLPGESSYRLAMIDVSTRKELWTTPPIAGSSTFSLRYRPDGARLALVSYQREGQGKLHVFDAATGTALVSVAVPADPRTRVAYGHDGRRLAGFVRDQGVSVWDADTGKLLQTCKGHAAAVTTGAFNRDGTRLVTIDKAGVVHHWDVTPGEPPPQEGAVYGRVIGAVTRDLRRVVVGRLIRADAPVPNAPVLVVDRNNKELSRFQVADEIVEDLALSPDGRRVAGVLSSQRGGSNRVVVWNAADGRELHSWPGLSGKPAEFLWGYVHFSPDGTRVAAVLSSPANDPKDVQSLLKIWDATTGKEVASVSDGNYLLIGLAFRADGKQLVTTSLGSDDRPEDAPTAVVQLWDAATGAERKTLKVLCVRPIATALSPDGNRIATVAGSATGQRTTVHITDVATGAEVQTLNVPDVSSVDFSPDGRRLATFATTAGVVKVWDTATGQELLTIKAGARRMSSPAGFSADGHSLYALDRSSTAENRLKVWDATPLPEKVK